jgi:hypothetical protein
MLSVLQVRDLVERCTCPVQFPMIRVSEGKYRIGDTKVLIFVRVSQWILSHICLDPFMSEWPQFMLSYDVSSRIFFFLIIMLPYISDALSEWHDICNSDLV